MNHIKRIAINTGGGDAPGLNAVIHAAVYAARNQGWEIFGIRDGLDGLLEPQNYPDGGLIKLTRRTVRDIAHLGGTILGTSNRGNPFKTCAPQPDGSVKEIDRSDELVRRFREHRLDALISVGGDGTLSIARELNNKGLRVIGVPKTIDNDLESTTTTFGFDTAVSFATECIDRLHFTAESHRRVMVVEVMGRYAGWIALHAGIAGRADAILLPEIPYDITRVASHIKRKTTSRSRQYSIVVAAEGAKPLGGGVTLKEAANPGHVERLGGVGEIVAGQLQELTGKESRAVVLGHLLRGGQPTSLDRSLGLIFGAAAVRGLVEGRDGVMVAVNPPRIDYVPLDLATARLKLVAADGYGVMTARILDISFGDLRSEFRRSAPNDVHYAYRSKGSSFIDIPQNVGECKLS
jgi:6-phosphofructokinase 1